MGWREPTAEEVSVLSLVEIDGGLTDFEQTYTDTILDFQDAAAEMIHGWIASGQLQAAHLAEPDSLTTFPGSDELKAELVRLLQGMAEFGKGQVEAELARQEKKGA